MRRREFLRRSALALGYVASVAALGGCSNMARLGSKSPSAEGFPLRFQRPLAEKAAQCEICFRRCVVREGRLGFCNNVKNVGGHLYSLVYGHPCALNVDPIEKEPIFHVLPGSTIFCLATAGCNFRCKFCQNWEISQRTMWELHNFDVSPAEVAQRAAEEGCRGVSFTYNDPIVFYDFVLDVAVEARERGLRVAFHTNGTLNPEPLKLLLEVSDVAVIDLKGFDTPFYRRYCGGELTPVLDTLTGIREAGIHLEVVNLIIPTLNDDLGEIRRMCRWLKEHVGPDVPLHFIRFFPSYRLKRLPPTPVETLEDAARVAEEEGLEFVYIGNVPGHRRNSTFCPDCGELLVERVHFAVLAVNLKEGKCPSCGREIPGIWE